ncbi:MAG: homocysteine S-methyltransferase family protein [Erythrobacter sp.]|nr:MAG: homocysteine S-methyltransferase family protein [Erythrobacter sp.]
MTMTILDGGTGQELVKRAGETGSPLWSVRVLADRPELVAEVHGDFLAAGADVITLASYAATPTRLERLGHAEDFARFQTAAVDAARRARDKAGRGRIAGVLPPLARDYRPEERLEPRAARSEYARLVEAQAGAVDLFLCETLPSIEEAVVATRAARASGLPVWTSVTVDESDGSRLRSGESLADAVRAAADEGAEAVLANCSPPEAISAACEVLSGEVAAFGAYANGFVSIEALREGAQVDGLAAREDLDPAAYARFAAGWRDAGASVIGGCCEVGPAHIAAVAEAVGEGG